MIFLTWNEFRSLKESNARKRAVSAAMRGLGGPLPGSTAACPSTNPRAMKLAKKYGVVFNKDVKEGHESKPDYSFDNWVKTAQDLGKEMEHWSNKAKKDEEELDKKKEKDKEEKKPQPGKDAGRKPEIPKEEEDAWKRLKQLHKDHLKSKESQKELSLDSKANTSEILEKDSGKHSKS